MNVTPSLDIEITDAQDHMPGRPPTSLADLARRVLAGEGVDGATISIALVDDATIHAINRRHLDHDWPTDVITFRALRARTRTSLEAELVVSAEMAATHRARGGHRPVGRAGALRGPRLAPPLRLRRRDGRGRRRMRSREDEVLRREGIVNTFALVGPESGPEGQGAPCRA